MLHERVSTVLHENESIRLRSSGSRAGATIALVGLTLFSSSASSQTPVLVDLDVIFEEPPDLKTRLLGTPGFQEAFVPEEPGTPHLPDVCGGVRHVAYEVNGVTFRGHKKTEFKFLGDAAPLYTVSNRLRLDLYLPATINFANATPIFFITGGTHAGSDSTDDERKDRIMATSLAQVGIPCVLQEEVDGPGPDTIPEQLDYDNPGDLSIGSLDWMMARSIQTAESLRFDYRYGLAQAWILAHTFFREYMLLDPDDLFTPDPPASWIEDLRGFYAGGSKAGVAVISSAGYDRGRVRGFYSSGGQGLDGGASGGFARYQTDWGFTGCSSPTFVHACPPPPDPRPHKRAPLALWAWEHRCDANSYLEVYSASRSPEFYRDLLIVDSAGTHDWINPLGSHRRFWEDRDGLTGGFVSGEEQWKYRVMRRIDQDHGRRYTSLLGCTVTDCYDGTSFAWAAEDILLMRAIRHLNRPAIDVLPRIEVAGLNVNQSPTEWSVTVRLTDLRIGHAFPGDEQYTVFLMSSDDWDLRRCDGRDLGTDGISDDFDGDGFSDPVVTNPPHDRIDTFDLNLVSDHRLPGYAPGVEDPDGADPHDAHPLGSPAWDDNKDDEDYFTSAASVSVVRVGANGNPAPNGFYRRITFQKPAFADTRLGAVIVQVRISGPDGSKCIDDMILSTDVVLAHEELLPPKIDIGDENCP